jgi:hypothetical protein
MDGNPVLVPMMPVMSVMDDGWKLRRNTVVQVAVSTARVDGYLVVGRWRTRVGIVL